LAEQKERRIGLQGGQESVQIVVALDFMVTRNVGGYG
jgi:hypothetical protein